MNKKIMRKVEGLLTTHPHRTFKPKEIARTLGVPKTDYPAFRDLIKMAARDGRIAKYRGNNFGSIKRATMVEGELHVKAQGYGFLIVGEGKEDIFISQKNMGTALNRDVVEVQLYAESKGQKREGRVVKIVERSFKNIVGTYRRTRKYGFVIPDDNKITTDVFIPEGDERGAKSGQKVVAKITQWEDRRSSPEGEIVEVLGYPDAAGVDVLSVIKAFDLPTKFPKNVEADAAARSVHISAKEIGRRLDLRKQVCFTIDPVDAKDFDDAVSLEVLGNGNSRLGVHIADVGHYVRRNSPMDREAFSRGNSVYLVDRVVPMLPEKLSNEICSLRPNTDRLTFSCIMEVTPKGKVVGHKITETIIHSKRRFTYEEVQKIINGESTSPFDDVIHRMYKLSQVLAKRRKQLGSLDFDLPEVKVELNKKGEPIAIQKRERLASHRLVEEFMLLANQTVTGHVVRTLGSKGRVPPFIYRVHEEPNLQKMEDFREFVKVLGHPLDPNKEITGKLLSDYLASLKGRPEEVIVQELMLRSMMKAKYSVKNAGHFGLAFKNYTHFTSPIRRYADLAVHRILRKYQNGVDFDNLKDKVSELETIAQKTSEREVVAMEAERESIKLKKVEYMQRHLGDEFEGVVSGVVPFGIFVELTDLLVEGLVHISDLEDDYYFHDEKNYRLVGQRTEKTYRLGDSIKVCIARVDPDQRVIDFLLSENSGGSGGAAKQVYRGGRRSKSSKR